MATISDVRKKVYSKLQKKLNDLYYNVEFEEDKIIDFSNSEKRMTTMNSLYFFAGKNASLINRIFNLAGYTELPKHISAYAYFLLEVLCTSEDKLPSFITEEVKIEEFESLGRHCAAEGITKEEKQKYTKTPNIEPRHGTAPSAYGLNLLPDSKIVLTEPHPIHTERIEKQPTEYTQLFTKTNKPLSMRKMQQQYKNEMFSQKLEDIENLKESLKQRNKIVMRSTKKRKLNTDTTSNPK